mmetsp:Transcript_29933/g.41438  ORF Transcript_29933/g.41438 Transcript_29933/m.41438 type:complete len:95 (+) Transcript_29933:61-345(+)
MYRGGKLNMHRQSTPHENFPSFLHARTNTTIYKPVAAMLMLVLLGVAVYYLERNEIRQPKLSRSQSQPGDTLAPPTIQEYKAGHLEGVLDATQA